MSLSPLLHDNKTAVIDALSMTYVNFDEQKDENLILNILAVLDDTGKSLAEAESRFESDAVYGVRMLLLSAYFQGVNSVKATVAIFEKLDRQNELGWLAK